MTEQRAEQETRQSTESDIEFLRRRRRELAEALRTFRFSLYRNILIDMLECPKCGSIFNPTKLHWFHVIEALVLHPSNPSRVEKALRYLSFADLVMVLCYRHGLQILNAIYEIWDSDLKTEEFWEDERIAAQLEQDEIPRRPDWDKGNYLTHEILGDLGEKPEDQPRVPNEDRSFPETLLCQDCSGKGCGKCRGGVVTKPPLFTKDHPDYDKLVSQMYPGWEPGVPKSVRDRRRDTKIYEDAKRDKTTVKPGTKKAYYPETKTVGIKPTTGRRGANYLNPRKRVRKPGEVRTIDPGEKIRKRREWERKYRRDYRKGLRRKPPYHV